MMQNRSRRLVSCLIAANAVALMLMFGHGPFLCYIDFESRIVTLLFCSAGLGLVHANAFAFRFLCYRFRKLPRTKEALRCQVTTNNVAEGPSNA